MVSSPSSVLLVPGLADNDLKDLSKIWLKPCLETDDDKQVKQMLYQFYSLNFPDTKYIDVHEDGIPANHKC
jgi:hypothetical protein